MRWKDSLRPGSSSTTRMTGRSPREPSPGSGRACAAMPPYCITSAPEPGTGPLTPLRRPMDNRPVSSRVLPRVLALALLAAPGIAAGQSATTPPHPSMPWGGVTTPLGQFVRFVYMPPQPVTLEYLVAGPAPAPLAAE